MVNNGGDDGGDDNCFLFVLQYQSKIGWGQRPHGGSAPFSSFLSLTRLSLFLHIEAPVREEMSLIDDKNLHLPQVWDNSHKLLRR